MTGQLGETKVIYTSYESAVAPQRLQLSGRMLQRVVAVNYYTDGIFCEITDDMQTDGER